MLSGKEAFKILALYGFDIVRQKGSHIIMQMKTEFSTVTILVPNHSELKIGTSNSIIRQSGLSKDLFV